MEGLGRIERTDHNVVPVRITECKLFGSSVGVHVGLLVESGDESTGPNTTLSLRVVSERSTRDLN